MSGLAEVKVALATELFETMEQAVAAGDYASTGAVIQAALENWQADQRRKQNSVAELRHLWDEGLASGPAEPIDVDAIKTEGRRRLEALRLKSGL